MVMHRAARASLCWLTALTLLSGILSSSAPAQDREGETSRAPRTHALLIGCNEYPVLKTRVSPEYYAKKVRLPGAAEDVKTWRATLRSVLGVPDSNIRTLTGWPKEEARAGERPSRANILGELRRLAHVARNGDMVVVAYSGHGVLVKDDDADEEPDGVDEAWMPADGSLRPKLGGAGVIRDDEIGAHLRAIRDKGALVWVVMDCCHSGSATRAIGDDDDDVVTRMLDPEAFGAEPLEISTRGAFSGFEKGAMATADDSLEGIVAMYAAQSDQAVPEIWLPSKKSRKRKRHGLLTTAVTRALHRNGTNLTFGELYMQVSASYASLRGSYPVDPLAEGMLERYVSGGASAPSPPLTLTRVGERLELSAGGMRGLEEGTEVAVYAPGKRGDEHARLGVVVVTELEPARAWCRPADGSPTKWMRDEAASWPVEVYRYVIGDWALEISCVDGKGRPLATKALPEDVRAFFDDNPVCFPLVARPSEADWVLMVGGGGEDLTLQPVQGAAGAPRFRTSREMLDTHLMQVFRARNLLRLRDHAGTAQLPSRFKLDAYAVLPGGREAKLSPGQRLSPGDTIGFRLRNAPDFEDEANPDQAFDVFAFWIDPNLGVTRLFPRGKGESPRIVAKDRKPRKLRSFLLSDEGVGTENLLILAMPQRKDAPELNLHFLAQPPQQLVELAGSRDAGVSDDTTALFEALAMGVGTRTGTPLGTTVDALAVGSFAWTTRWGRVRVPPSTRGMPSAELPATAATRGTPKPDAPPDAWAFGSKVRLAAADGAWCVLIAEGDGAQHVLIDLDGSVSLENQNADGLKRLVADRSFGADLALRLQPGRRTIWYDTDRDGKFDLVLEDNDRDRDADVAYLRAGDGWTKRAGIAERWLDTSRFRKLRGRESATALRRVRAITE